MIPRTLVPVNVRPVKPDEAKKIGHRLETYMDERTVVPSGLSDAPPLDGHTSIPAHFPLDVLVHRTLVSIMAAGYCLAGATLSHSCSCRLSAIRHPDSVRM